MKKITQEQKEENTVGDTATVLSDAEILKAIEKLESIDKKDK